MPSHLLLLTAIMLGSVATTAAAAATCKAESASTATPVIELYTSEGCSSCPPADRWVSTLKDSAASGQVVVQAFHVGYWDHIGWVDRFAAPGHTVRQKQIADRNKLNNIYTPQVVRDGRDWQGERIAIASSGSARARLTLQQSTAVDSFEATVVPADTAVAWAAYWTVTEQGHASKVKSGENAGELLRHDFVVRQYVPAGDYRGPATLTLRAIPRDPAHPRQINLVVFDPRSGKPLQSLSVAC